MYPFENLKTGEIVDMFLTMDETPKIGATITYQSEEWVRLPSPCQVSAAVARICHKFPYKSHSSCKNAPGASGYDKNGVAIISSQRNLREFVAANRNDGMDLD